MNIPYSISACLYKDVCVWEKEENHVCFLSRTSLPSRQSNISRLNGGKPETHFPLIGTCICINIYRRTSGISRERFLRLGKCVRYTRSYRQTYQYVRTESSRLQFWRLREKKDRLLVIYSRNSLGGRLRTILFPLQDLENWFIGLGWGMRAWFYGNEFKLLSIREIWRGLRHNLWSLCSCN